MMRKLYGFFNEIFSLLIITCCDNAWHVYISMPPPLNQILVKTILFIFSPFFCGGGGGRGLFSTSYCLKFGVTGRFLTKSFQYKSFRYKFIQSRCKKFHVLGLKNEEYSPQMCKLYLNWSKFSCNLSAWGRIETTRMEMTLKRKKQIPNSEHCSLRWYHCDDDELYSCVDVFSWR